MARNRGVETSDDQGQDLRDRSRSSPRHRYIGWVIPIVLVGVNLMLAFRCIGCLSFWYDEGFSFWYSQRSWSELLGVIAREDASMPLYYLLLKPWSALGSSEAVLRSASALAGAGAVVVTYMLGARLFGRLEAFLAGGVLALHVFLIQYQQETRGYSLAVLLVVLSTYFLVDALETRTRRAWLVYGGAAALAAASHAFAWFIILVQLGVIVWHGRQRPFTRRTLLWGGALLAPALALLIPLARANGQGRWGWINTPGIGDLLDTLAQFTAGDLGIGWWAFAIPIGLFVMAWTGSETDVGSRWRFTLVGASFLVPILGAFLVSYIRPIFVERYLIVALPGLALMVGAGIARIRFRPGIAVMAILIAAVSIQRLDNYYAHERKQEWRTVVSHVVDRTEVGDGLIFYHRSIATPFAYYMERGDLWDEGPRFVFPEFRDGRPSGDLEFADLVDSIGQGRADLGRRVWVVLAHNRTDGERTNATERLLAALDRGYRAAFSQPFTGIQVRLYEPL